MRAQAYVALDQGYITRPQFDQLNALATETGRLIGGFIVYLSKNLEKPTRNP